MEETRLIEKYGHDEKLLAAKKLELKYKKKKPDLFPEPPKNTDPNEMTVVSLACPDG